MSKKTKPVLLDVDPGIDDSLAILLALRSSELRVEGITVVAGNVEVDLGVQNALRILDIAGRLDIPVAKGAERPLKGKLKTAKHVHGENGLGNLQIPLPSTMPSRLSAVELIRAKVEEHSGEITLIPLGPLTNIAMALKHCSSLASRIKEIVMMGGSFSGGNITAAAEFNIFNDPEAAEIVFQSGIPLTMVGLDVTRKTKLSPRHMAAVKPGNNSPIVRLVQGLGNFRFQTRKDKHLFLHDPLAVGVAIDAGLVTTERLPVQIETLGKWTRGQTVVDRRATNSRDNCPGPEVQVCLEVDAQRFVDFFLRRVLGYE